MTPTILPNITKIAAKLRNMLNNPTFVDPHGEIWNEFRQQNNEWVAAHPNFCRACCGYGATYYPPTGSKPNTVDICSNCVEKNVCPVCSKSLTTFTLNGMMSSRCDCCGQFDESDIWDRIKGMPEPDVGYDDPRKPKKHASPSLI